MTVAERFLKYIAVDTTSDPSSETFPSTKSQIDFANMLAEEMKAMGLENVTVIPTGMFSGPFLLLLMIIREKSWDLSPTWILPARNPAKISVPVSLKITTERTLY